MSKGKDVKITRSEFIELIYGQVGETFIDMLKYHEKDDDDSQFANLKKQNAACKFMGIDISARDQINTITDKKVLKEVNHRISVIRRELTEKIIGLFYDVLVEELEEEALGKSSDTLAIPDGLKEFYTMANMNNCPIEPESVLSKCRYLLGRFSNASVYAEDEDTLMPHMIDLGIMPLYMFKNGSRVSKEKSKTVHLPEDEGEMLEALTRGIPEDCIKTVKDKKPEYLPYADMPKERNRIRFVYPDLAMTICRMYLFRNTKTHRADWTNRSMSNKCRSVEAVILAGMIVTMKNVWPLTLAIYRRNDDELIGAVKYVQSIVKSYQDSKENRLCCDFNWKLYEGNPDYVRNLNITKSGPLKKICFSLWSEGQGKANLLQGVAGCGKSWALRRMYYSYACDYLGFDKDKNPGEEEKIFCPLIPVYIPMVDWYKEMKDSDSVIGVISRIIINNTAFDERTREKIPEGVRSLLEKGRFLIIFDGVDECPYEKKGSIYMVIDSFINSIAGGKSANLCMISDREISVNNQAGMISYAAEAIVDGNVKEYVKKFLKYTRPDLIDEEGHLSAIENDRFLEKLKAMKPSSEIKTAFELAKLVEICADEEAYRVYLSKPEEKRKYFLDVIYLRVLLDRESKEKLSAEDGSSEKHMDSLRGILVHLSEKFEDESISMIDKDSLDKDIMSVAGVDATLAKAYRKHLVQAGILTEFQDKIDLKWYYRFAGDDLRDAAGLL